MYGFRPVYHKRKDIPSGRKRARIRSALQALQNPLPYHGKRRDSDRRANAFGWTTTGSGQSVRTDRDDNRTEVS